MKQGERKGKNHKLTLQRAAVVSVTAAVLASCALGAWLVYGGREEQPAAAYAETVEVGAVQSEELLATYHTKLNERATKPVAGDTRSTFRIIEVIPHEVCSVFPYLVDWKTEEEYEKNVVIGYEGLMSINSETWMNLFSEEDTPAKDSAPFTRKDNMQQQLSLSNYQALWKGKKVNDGRWYRRSLSGSDGMMMQDGYFEYVGEGNGLYYLSMATVTAQPEGNGIRYETRAADRTGTQSPKGELYLADAAYYQAKENSGAAYPDYLGKPVVSRSGYHYNLSFTQDDTGSYVADSAHIVCDGEQKYDYLLEIDADKINTWSAGFSYAKGGNYTVGTVTPASNGKYVRIADSKQPDGYRDEAAGIYSGHFEPVTDKTETAPRYDVTFTHQAAGGSYYANKPQTWSVLSDAGYRFVYVGTGKGLYQVPFSYIASDADSRLRYRETLLEVKHNSGNYALTSTGRDGDGNPVYREKDGSGAPADYVQFVKNISFVDEKMQNSEDPDTSDSHHQSKTGVFLGGGNSGDWHEKGGFIFVPVNSTKDMEATRVSSLPKNTVGKNSNTDEFFKVGDRIYVTNQSRRYRYYCRDGFYNNEWFKLLCYSNNPQDPSKAYTQMVNGVGYDYDKTAGENLANPVAKQILSEFDANIRIEIQQIELQKLTPEDVKGADLLYFSKQEAFNALSGHWDEISDYREESGLEPLPPIPRGGLNFSGDLRDDTLMTLYDECIWERNCALVMSADLMGNGSSARTNLHKLAWFMNFFKEARVWAEFLPDLYPSEANPDFSRVRSDASVEVYGDPDWSYCYNRRFVKEDAQKHNTWITNYFLVSKPGQWSDHNIVPGYEFNDNITADIGVVKDGETKLIINWWIPSFLRDIGNQLKLWQILQNSERDNSRITVDILNAETTAEEAPRKVIYADEFDPETFVIEYQVNVLGSSAGKKPKLQRVTVAWEDGGEFGGESNAQYATPYRVSARRGFTQDGSSGGALNPATVMRTAVITAEAENGKTGSAEVSVIVREGFNLN